MFDGLDFVSPEQIQELAVPVIAHRLVMEPQARFSGQTARTVVEDVLKAVLLAVSPGMPMSPHILNIEFQDARIHQVVRRRLHPRVLLRVGGFRPADVEHINAEVAKFLDVVTRGGERLR